MRNSDLVFKLEIHNFVVKLDTHQSIASFSFSFWCTSLMQNFSISHLSHFSHYLLSFVPIKDSYLPWKILFAIFTQGMLCLLQGFYTTVRGVCVVFSDLSPSCLPGLFCHYTILIRMSGRSALKSKLCIYELFPHSPFPAK